jgi:two-component system, NarL family, response regulator DesR
LVRVLVVEELLLLRAAMSSLLSQADDVLVVGAVGPDPRMVPTVVALRPEVAVIDIDGEHYAGIAVAEELGRSLPESAVLMLTGRSSPARLSRALDASPKGLLNKDSPARTLLDGVRRLGRGETVIEPALAVAAIEARRNPLTPREQDVLRLAEDGLLVDEIADRMFLSIGTVRNYLSSAVCKTKARNRIDAIKRARQAGWT